MSNRLSFGTDDLTLVDWNAAVVFDAEADETRLVLEFANVQLLELRHLDAALDRTLDQAYATVTQAERGVLPRLRPPIAARRAFGELQMDAAILFERVTHALKLVGDQFLSRLYTMVSSRSISPTGTGRSAASSMCWTGCIRSSATGSRRAGWKRSSGS